jgi:glycosyltransferase involved in cell wall biosynthesis
MTNPLVSVIIPSHNYAHLIAETIQSIIAQTCNDLEIIVIDDESTDNTKQIVSNYSNYYPVKYFYIKHEGKATPAHAMNYGLTKAKGDFIIFVASDDLILPNYIEKCYSLYTFWSCLQGIKIGLIWTGCKEFGTSDELRIPRISLTSGKYDFFINPSGQLGSMLVPKDVYKKVGKYDETLSALEDWDMAIRILLKGYRAASVPEPLALYREHKDNCTPEKFAKMNKGFDELRKKYENLVK